jgi:hypothetical protein
MNSVTRKEISDAASIMGKRGYRSKVEKLGIDRIQAIARKNGKKGGRPRASGEERENKS